MIDTVDQKEWSDVALGILDEGISSGFSNTVVKITFDDGIIPLPEAPFIFVIGGNKRIKVGSEVTIEDTGNREIVMCVEKVSDKIYSISRDPLNLGKLPPEHSAGEIVYQNTMGGTVWSSVKQLDFLASKEGQIAYLEELLLVLFGVDTTVITQLWPEYDHFAVTTTAPESQEVQITPGGYFVRNEDKEGLVKILVVAPGMKIYGRSHISLEYPPDKRKRRALVYIDNEGEISVFYGETTTRELQEPSEISVSSISNMCQPLAELYLDSVASNKVITADNIKDLRQWAV